MKEELQNVGFQIIAAVGTAKSLYIEAMREAKKDNLELAKQYIKQGDEEFSKGHTLHFDLIQKEANGEDLPFSLMFMHAEDQLMSTETIKILCLEIIELYQRK